MKTMIISAFPGCRKIYLLRKQEKYGYSIADIDIFITSR